VQAVCAADALTGHSQQLMGQTSQQTVVRPAHSSGGSFHTNKEISLFPVAREDFNIAIEL